MLNKIDSGFYIDLYVRFKDTPDDQKIYNKLGNEYSIIYNDLKTLKGVLNRLKKLNWSNLFMEVIGFKIVKYEAYPKYYNKEIKKEVIIDTLKNKEDKKIFEEVLQSQNNNI